MDETAVDNSPKWSPLSVKQRRVLGTLMEKSKTTPDAYPMTFAGLTTGCNQKSNRAPVTNYTNDQVEQTVNELKSLGAVTLVHGNGRVEKVRHYAYQWLGLSKVEAAVMTELLLRGHQTVGELRTRASRMEPIADLAELTGLLRELESRNLVVMLTPFGRGQIVSHNLYQEWELEELKKTIDEGGWSSEEEADESAQELSQSNSPRPESRAVPSRDAELDSLRKAVETLSARVAYLEKELGISPPIVGEVQPV
jgi:uncharacterized protein YceH (UPF0502 family)